MIHHVAISKSQALLIIPLGIIIAGLIKFALPYFLPVVAFVEPYTLVADDGNHKIAGSFSGYRTSRSCEYLSAQGWVKTSGGHGWQGDVSFSFFSEVGYQENKPRGMRDFGEFQWDYYYQRDVIQVLLVTSHMCSGDIIDTAIGPFTVSRGP